METSEIIITGHESCEFQPPLNNGAEESFNKTAIKIYLMGKVSNNTLGWVGRVLLIRLSFRVKLWNTFGIVVV